MRHSLIKLFDFHAGNIAWEQEEELIGFSQEIKSSEVWAESMGTENAQHIHDKLYRRRQRGCSQTINFNRLPVSIKNKLKSLRGLEKNWLEKKIERN